MFNPHAGASGLDPVGSQLSFAVPIPSSDGPLANPPPGKTEPTAIQLTSELWVESDSEFHGSGSLLAGPPPGQTGPTATELISEPWVESDSEFHGSGGLLADPHPARTGSAATKLSSEPSVVSDSEFHGSESQSDRSQPTPSGWHPGSVAVDPDPQLVLWPSHHAPGLSVSHFLIQNGQKGVTTVFDTTTPSGSGTEYEPRPVSETGVTRNNQLTPLLPSPANALQQPCSGE